MRKANICFKGIPDGIIHLHSILGRGRKYANDILQNKTQVVNTGKRYETRYEIEISYISRHITKIPTSQRISNGVNTCNISGSKRNF